jgi:hypothetical protein
MRNATGMLPSAGALSAFGAGSLSPVLVGAVDAARASRGLTAEKGIAAAIPKVAELLSKSLLFIMT